MSRYNGPLHESAPEVAVRADWFFACGTDLVVSFNNGAKLATRRGGLSGTLSSARVYNEKRF